MKKIARLVFSLVLLILSLAPAAQADLSCSDCFRICLLSYCGFNSDPGCESFYWSTCESECQPPACTG